MDKTEKTDIVVIGSGPGGYAAAFRAADLGKKVVLVEKDKTLGGVCLNRGCIPSKALLHIVRVMAEVAHLEKVGVSYGKPKIDIKTIRESKEKIVSQLGGGIEKLAKARGVEVINGSAFFSSNSELSIESNKNSVHLLFDKCIIAAGSKASMIPNAPIEHSSILTSRTALQLNEVPKKLLVIGGGVIGLELGQVYASLGASVSVVEFLPEIIPGADSDVVKPLLRRLKKEFSSISFSSKVVGFLPMDEDTVKVVIEHENQTKEEVFDRVLVSVGRKPNSSSLGISNTDIKTNENEFIVVDDYQRTSVKNIFAIGDIVGNPMLAHKATYEGKIAAEVACGLPAAMDASVIPSVVYTDPEVAWVGLTEKEARLHNIPYEKSEFPWAASGKAMIVNAIQGKTKTLFDPVTKRLLGAAIVGPAAGDLISEACLAIEMGADAEDVGLTIHPHPTLGETFAAATEVFSGTMTDLYVPPKGVK